MESAGPLHFELIWLFNATRSINASQHGMEAMPDQRIKSMRWIIANDDIGHALNIETEIYGSQYNAWQLH